MAKITWTSEAERWLKFIYEYIAEDNPIATANVIEGIFKKTQILSMNRELVIALNINLN